MKKIKQILSSLLVIAMICTFVPFDQLPKGILGEALSSLANYIKAVAADTEYTSGVYTYKLNDEGNAIITKYNGYENNVTVPSSLDGHKVVEIGSSVYQGKLDSKTGIYNSPNVPLLSVTIPDSIIVIDGSAFSNCRSLTSVRLSNSLKEIGAKAFEACINLTSITIPKSLNTVVEGYFDLNDGPFKNCDNLSNISFEAGIKKIIEHLFTDCSGLTSITIPSTVETIGWGAFNNCENLTSVVIPDSVTEISGAAFSKCKNITSVTIPDSVTVIGGAAFSNCANLTSVRLSNSLKEIGAKAFEACINLTSITIPKSLNTVVEGYSESNDGPFENCDNLNNISFETGIQKIIGSLFYKCSGIKNITIPNTVTMIEAWAFGDCKNLTSVAIPSTVETIGWGAFNNCENLTSVVIPDSVTEISDSAFRNCTNLTIYGYTNSVAETYANKNNIPFKSIGEYIDDSIGGTATGITNDQGIKLYISDKFDIPGNVPVIGGETFNLNLDKVGISYTQAKNGFKLGVGVSEELLKKDDEFKGFKKFVETNKKSYAEGMQKYIEASTEGGFVSIGAKLKPEASVYGYFEGTIDKNGQRHGTGKIVAKFKAKVSNEWQVVVVNIPVVISASLEVSVEGTVNIIFINSKSLGINGELKFDIPKFTPKVGIGIVKIANASVYGEIANEIGLSSNRVTAAIKGEAGVSVKVFDFEYKHPIWKTKSGNLYTYYDSQKKSKSRSVSTINYENVLDADSYEIAERTRSTEIGKTAANNENIKTILSGCSNDTKPQVVTFSNNKALMVYTDDVSTRTTGNQSAVMYKTFDGTEWSDAKMLSDDGTADFYPQAASDGETAYITWMNADKNLTSDSELTDTTKACDISVIKFDSSNMSVSGSETKLTNDSELDMMPTIDVSSTPTIMWVKNSNSDILTQTGTNTIYYSTLSGTSWTSAKEYKSYTSTPIIDLSVGNINGEESVAYTLDEDNDLTTTDDVELYTGKLNETPAKLTNNISNEKSIKFATIDGQNALIWFNNETLEYTKDLSKVTTLNSTSSASADYDIINVNNKDVAIFSVSENNGANLYASEIEDGFVLKQPIKLTDLGGYSRNISAKALNDKYLFAFTKTDATIEEDDVKENTDLCVYYSSAYHNLAVSELEYNDEDIIPGQKAKMTVTVTNNGLIDESNFAVTVKDPNGNATNITVNETLKPGESRNIEIDVTIPENISEQAEFSVETTPSTGNNLTNSVYTTNIGNTDLQLSSQTNENDAKITVENISGFDTNATLILRSGNSNGDIIDQIDLGSINAGGSKTETILFNKYNDVLRNNQTIYIEVLASSYEIYKSDNYTLIYASNTNQKDKPSNTIATKSPSTKSPKIATKTNTKSTAIKKAKVKNLKVKTKGKKITVSWKKIKIAKGYQVQVATNKQFKKKKIVFDKFTKKRKLIIKSSKIKRKKTYYVRVRAYAKTNDKKVNGKWSKKVRVKIK